MRRAFYLLLLTWLIFLGFSVCARAQDGAPLPKDPLPPTIQSLERRIQELEETIKRMQSAASPIVTVSQGTQTPVVDTLPSPAKLNQQSPTPPSDVKSETVDSSDGKSDGGTEKKTRPVAGWDNGFFLRSSDNRFNLRITGQIQADYRTFLDDVDFVDIDTFFLRRARLGIEADLLQYYEFRFLPDFGQGQAKIQDAYINVHYVDWLQVEAGKFKQPFSYEQLIQDRYVPTLERSMIDQLVPARDEGVMIHGQKLFRDRLDYAGSVSNGEINGDSDTNDRKDVVGRVVVRPFNCEYCWPILHLLQIGISGSVGIEEEPVNPSTLKTPAGVPWFQFSPGVRADGRRERWSPEIAYFLGSFGAAAQYFGQEQRLRPAFTGPSSNIIEDVPFDGFYVLATYLVTGEERTAYSQQLRPIRDFNPCWPFACPGAWELVARVSRLNVDDKVFAGGLARLADPRRSAGGATELTVGFNWYLNAWVRTQFNWEHAWFDSDVRLGPGPEGLLDHQDTLMLRFQIIF
jgi:phosphate-selective porin OprO/OprP